MKISAIKISTCFSCLIVFLFSPIVCQADDCNQAVKLLAGLSSIPVGSAEAEEKLKQILAHCPALADAHLSLGANYLAQKKYSEALSSFKQAVKIDPTLRFMLALAEGQVVMEQFQDAEKNYHAILEKEPDNVQAMQGLSVVYRLQKNLAQAEEMLRRALQIDPDRAEIFYNLGIILEELGRPDEALVSYRTAVQRKRNYVDAYFSIGRISLGQGNLREAKDAANSARLHRPNDVNVNMLFARIAETEGDHPGALKLVEKSLAMEPENVSVLVSKGILLVKLGKAKEGQEVLEKLAQRYPKSGEILSALGWVYLEQKLYDQALKTLIEAVKLNDRDYLAHNNLGVLYELTERKDLAKQEFSRALELNPGLGAAKGNLSRFK